MSDTIADIVETEFKATFQTFQIMECAAAAYWRDTFFKVRSDIGPDSGFNTHLMHRAKMKHEKNGVFFVYVY